MRKRPAAGGVVPSSELRDFEVWCAVRGLGDGASPAELEAAANTWCDARRDWFAERGWPDGEDVRWAEECAVLNSLPFNWAALGPGIDEHTRIFDRDDLRRR
jgi:hypothetical protein